MSGDLSVALRAPIRYHTLVFRPSLFPAVMTALALPPLIGHRCARAEAPENTLAGLGRAAALGVSWVEVDIRLAADGVPVLLHDATLDRTTTGHGRLDAHSLADLARVEAAPGEPVPTLATFLTAALGFGVGVNLELKIDADEAPGLPERLTRAVLATLDAVWPETAPPPLLSSFEPACLAAAARLAPARPRGLLLEALPPEWAKTAAEVGAAAIITDHGCIADPKTVVALAAGGRRVAVYTLNDPGRARLLLAWGVTAIISDHPDLLSRKKFF